MSPTTFAYIDYMQSDASLEPPVYATLRLKTAYSFEPSPGWVDAKFIKGGQANLWTEQMYNTRHLQYMVWPRGLALAERSGPQRKKKTGMILQKGSSRILEGWMFVESNMQGPCLILLLKLRKMAKGLS